MLLRNRICCALLFLLSFYVASACGAEFNLKDFGSVGDGKVDDLPAFKAALKKITALGGEQAVLRVPAGTYRLDEPIDPKQKWNEDRGHLVIDKMSNLTIEAEGGKAVLVGLNPYCHVVFVRDSKNITLKNLAIDYDPLPFTQGIITQVDLDKKMIEVEIDKGYSLPDLPHLDNSARNTQNVGYVFDPQTGRKLNQFYDHYLRHKVKKVAERTFRYITSNGVTKDMVGKRFAVVGRRKADAVTLRGVNKCLLENVEVYTAPACGYNVSGSRDVVIDHCKIIQKPGTDRVMSTVADGLHSKWDFNGPVLSNSYFTGMGDDAVNIGGSYAPVIEQPDRFSLIVGLHGSIAKKDADLYWLDTRDYGHGKIEGLKQTKQVKVKGYKKRCLKLTFSKELPAMKTWKDTDNDHTCDQIVNLNACGRGAKVINCHFYNHRVRGVLMRCPDGVVKGNHFDTLAGPGVVVSNDVGFLTEGPGGNGTVIENNRFTRIERSNIWINSPAGEAGKLKNPDRPLIRGIENIKIIGNTFEDYGGQNLHGRGVVGNIFFLNGASNIEIKDNIIGKPADKDCEAPLIIMNNTSGVSFSGNTGLKVPPNKP